MQFVINVNTIEKSSQLWDFNMTQIHSFFAFKMLLYIQTMKVCVIGRRIIVFHLIFLCSPCFCKILKANITRFIITIIYLTVK